MLAARVLLILADCVFLFVYFTHSGNCVSSGTAQLVTSQQMLQGKGLTPQHLAILQQKAQVQHQAQQQQQRLQLKKQEQLKLLQQQQLQQAQQPGIQQQQTAQGSQQQVIVTTAQFAGLTVQTMKGPVSVRATAPQISANQLTVQQQQQILQHALQKQMMQKVHLGAIGTPQMQQLISRQKLTPQQQLQLQQISRQQQLQQQQLKFQQQQQQQRTGTATPPKPQLVMTQVGFLLSLSLYVSPSVN